MKPAWVVQILVLVYITKTKRIPGIAETIVRAKRDKNSGIPKERLGRDKGLFYLEGVGIRG